MDILATDKAATAPNEDSSNTIEPGSTNFDLVQSIASGEDTSLVSRTPGEVLTRVELDLACFSEKLVNLNILVMHVVMRESDFEAFVSDRDRDLGDSALKALEFDLLSGFLDSEVRELDSFMSTVQTDIANIREFVSLYKPLGQALKEIEDKIHDSEESLKQSMDQVSEIRAQSDTFQRIVSCCIGEENEEGRKGIDFIEDGNLVDLNAKVKLQTAEQQRHFLRMLEKSLARELDLEKKVTELRQIEEELRAKLHSSEQEVFFMEEQALLIWERLFAAENSANVLSAISQETLTRLNIVQFSLNDSTQREGKLRSELGVMKEQMNRAETRAVAAEGECRSLSETNLKLNEELHILRRDESEKVALLESKLEEYEIKLQHALASADASQEKQGLLYTTISDMENLIEDMKSRVLRAEIRAKGVGENCIKLSESNSELNDEVNYLRSRLECLEGSLRKAEEAKLATAKDIGVQTKVITNLVMQLALERARLHKQLSSLTKENKRMFSKHECNKATRAEESKERSNMSTTGFEMEKQPSGKSIGGAETKLETLRNIDAKQLNSRYVIMAALALAISALAGFWVNQAHG